jgi:hypothetical protein
MKRALFLLALTVVFSSFAVADIRQPDPPKQKTTKSIDTTLSIRIDSDAKDARLIIPKNQIKQLRAELEQLDNEQDSNASVTTGFTRTQTIVSGIFMSLALVFGGVWFTRSRKVSTKIGKATITGAVLFLVASVASVAFANIGPPFEARSITGKIFSNYVHQYKQASGKIKLETSDTGYVQLIVPDAKDDKPNKEE